MMSKIESMSIILSNQDSEGSCIRYSPLKVLLKSSEFWTVCTVDETVRKRVDESNRSQQYDRRFYSKS